jgi:hypothetical protein
MKVSRLVFILTLLFLSTSVYATIEFQEPIFLNASFGTGLSPTAWRPKAFFYNDDWYVGVETDDVSTTGFIGLARYDSNLTTLEDGWYHISDTILPSAFSIGDWVLYPNEVVPNEQVIQLLGGGDGPVYEQSVNITLSVLNNRLNNSYGVNSNPFTWVSYGNDGSEIWKTDGVVSYNLPFNYNEAYMSYADGNITLPSALNDYTHPTLFWDDDNSQYIFLGESSYLGNQGIWAIYFDSNFTYLSNDGIATATGYYHSYPSITKKDDDIYLVTYTRYNNSQADNVTIVIDYLDFGSESYSVIKQENVIPTNAVNVTGDNTWTLDAYTVYEESLESDLVFYVKRNATTGLGEMYVLKGGGCDCSDWVNTTTCLEQQMRQTRICYPSECADEQ